MFLTNILFAQALDATIRSATPLPEGLNHVIDKTVEEGKQILSVEDVNITFDNVDEVKAMYEAVKKIDSIPENLSTILDDAIKSERTLENDLKAGAFNAITIFTNDPNHLKQLKDFEVPKNFKLMVSTNQEEAKKLNVQFPGIYAYNASEKNKFSMEIPEDFKSILPAVSLNSFSQISQENFSEFRTLTQKILYFISDKESFEDASKTFAELSKKYSGKSKIVYFSPTEIPTLIKISKLSSSDYPALMVLEKDKKMLVKNITGENFDSSVKNLLEGTAESIKFCAELPEDNDSRAVKIINTETLPIIKKGTETDKIILFSSTSCHHCKVFEPILQKLAKALQEKNIPIFIGKYDVNENESVTDSVPVIYFKKQGSEELIDISSKRTMKDLLDHLVNEAVSAKISLENFADLVEEKAEKVQEQIDDHLHEDKTSEESTEDVADENIREEL